MNIFNLCLPAFVYLLIILIVVLIDISKNNFRLGIFKLIGGVIITFLLNILCSKNLSLISYIFVFYPLIITTLSMIYVMFYTGTFSISNNILYKK